VAGPQQADPATPAGLGITYAGDLAAFTVASGYLYRAGGAGYVGLLGLDAIMKPYPVRRAEPVRATDMSRTVPGSPGETYIRKTVGHTGFEPVTSSVSGNSRVSVTVGLNRTASSLPAQSF
jgi:hypothetical protein